VYHARAQHAAADSLLRLIHTAEGRVHQGQRADTTLIRLLNQLAYFYDGYKTDSAMLIAEKARSLAEELKDNAGLSRAYINIGNINETKGKYDAALAAHERGIAIAQSIGDKSLAARGYNGAGIVHWDKGNYQAALQSYLRSLALYEELKDTTNAARAVNNIAILYQQMNNLPEAMRYYQHSYQLALKGSDKKSVAIALGNIGQLHHLERRTDSALAYLQASHAIAVELGDKHTIAARLTDIGEVFQHEGRYNKALEYLFQALQIKEEIGGTTYLVDSYRTIAATLAAAGRASEGLVYARRAVDSAESIGAKAYLRDALSILVAVYDSLGRYKEALATMRRLADVRDSLISTESLNKMLQLQAEYESEKKDRQILILTKDRELQDTTRRMLLIIGVVLLAALGAMYSRYRLKASSEQALQRQNAEILRQQHLLEEQAADIEVANTALHEKNLVLERQQRILEEQARDIEIANTELQERNVQLQQLNQEKNDLMGIVAHDLKNPLTTIVFASSSLVRYKNKFSAEEQVEQLLRIQATAQRMNEMVLHLLDMNAIESGAVKLHNETFDLVLLVHEVVEEHRPKATAKRIGMTCMIPGGEATLLIHADRRITTEVLENLVSNAVKYSPADKNIYVRVKSSNNAVRVEVQDEGPGISQEDMKKLFGKFARLSAQPTGGEHSTGLGLSIVKKLVEAMQGRVWCESELGKGATFIVELPQAASAA
jgi:signal transduction histidine kinase